MTGLIRKAFFFLIIFTPLAFGTVEPWSYAVMEIISFLALVFVFIAAGKNNSEILSVPGIVPLLLFLLFILIQLIPLPDVFVKFLSPKAYEIHQNSALLSGLSGLSGLDSSFIPLSVHPKAGLTQFFRWASCIAFYILTVQLLKDKDMLKRTVIVITVFGAMLSFSSILQFYLTEDMALWFRHIPDNSMIVGPYICHNHYAGLMEMIFPVVLAFFFFYRPRVRNSSIFKGIIEIFAQEKANVHILIGAAALLIVTSVFVSLSRGGMLSLTFSLVFFTWLLLKRKISRGNTILIVAIIALTALTVSWFGWDQIFERFERLKNVHGVIHESRLDFWKDSKNIIKDFPVTGSGMGTFIDIYPSYQTVQGNLTIAHAHNDYIELACEGGIIGFFLAASFIIILFFKTYRVFLGRKDAYSVYIYMGAVTGLLSILFHSFTDFNMQIGANRLWFFFMAGLAVSAANTGIRENSQKTRLKPVDSIFFRRLSSAALFIMMAGVLAFNFSNLTGKFYFSHIKNFQTGVKTPGRTLEKIRLISDYASKFDPLCADYHYAGANASLFLKQEKSVLKDLAKAIYLNPLNSIFLKRAGLYMIKKGETDSATKLLKASVDCDISDAENALQYGAWLISQNRAGQGIQMIKQAVSLDTKLMDRALTNMAVLNVDYDKMQNAVPQIPGPALAYADFLYNSGKRKEAETNYLAALDYIEKEEKISRWQYYRIYRFFLKRGKTKKALKVMQRAAAVLPFDPEIRIIMGDIYKKMGVTYRAEQEYEQALFIDSKNTKAKNRLKQIRGRS